LQVIRQNRAARRAFNLQPSAFGLRRAFSIIEVLMVISLLSLIVLALMEVFSTTQRAFRAGVTQSDVLEGGREAVDLITSDLRLITPSGGASNIVYGSVNFFALDNSYSSVLAYTPLLQSLPGGSVQRTNVLNYFFLLGRENTKWTGIGYVVNPSSSSPLYPLYRFFEQTNTSISPQTMFFDFLNDINNGQWTNMSHVVDGVVHFVVRPCDVNGYPMTSTYQYESGQWVTNNDVAFYPGAAGGTGFYFFSNTVPASVELEMGVLEDRTLQRAASLPNNAPAAPPNDRRTLYLQGKSGNVHLFRQRVTIPNVDPTAYQ
jgi:hypothetical protein